VFVFKVLLIDYQLNFLLYDAIYTDINWLLFALPLVIVVCFVAIKGIKVIARCYQIFLPFALLIFVITMVIAFTNANFDNVLPLFSHSHSEFMNALSYILIQSCEYIFLFMIMENVSANNKFYYTKISVTLVIIFVLVELFYVLFVAVLGNLAPFVRETLITMTQFKDTSYGYFKIDIFTTVFWIPIIVLQNAFCVYSIAFCLNKVFDLNTTYGCVGVVSVLFITHFIPQINNHSVTNFFYEKIGVYVLAFLLVLPVLLLIASLKSKPKKEKKNEKD
ncbi:MAG: GerAB/ArcD/ProY family transporter, partial [Christensenellales bacterium]